VTGRHRGPKRKLRAGVAWTAYFCKFCCLPECDTPWWVLLQRCIMLRLVFFIAECGIARFLCHMHVFDIRASSSTPRLPLCQISFLSQAPTLS